MEKAKFTYSLTKDESVTPATFNYTLNVVAKDEESFVAKIEEFLKMYK